MVVALRRVVAGVGIVGLLYSVGCGSSQNVEVLSKQTHADSAVLEGRVDSLRQVNNGLVDSLANLHDWINGGVDSLVSAMGPAAFQGIDTTFAYYNIGHLSPEDVVRNARRAFSLQSKQVRDHFEMYAPIMVKANHDIQSIFPIPLVMHIALIYQESGFDPLATSYYARGVTQVSDETAVLARVGLRLFTKEESPQLWELDQQLKGMNETIRVLSNLYQGVRNRHAYDSLGLVAKELDVVTKARRDFFRKDYVPVLHQEINRVSALGSDALANWCESYVPAIEIPKSARELAWGAKRMQERFGGPPFFNALRSLSVYDAGIKWANDGLGLPVNTETPDYWRRILYYMSVILDPSMPPIPVSTNPKRAGRLPTRAIHR